MFTERGYTGVGTAGGMRGAGDPQNPFMGCPAPSKGDGTDPCRGAGPSSKRRRSLPRTCCRHSCAGEPFLNFLVVQKQTCSHSRLPLRSGQEGEADRSHGNSQLTATWEGQPPATAFPGPQPSPLAPPGGTPAYFP